MSALLIRPYEDTDFDTVVALWHTAGLVRPWNDPARDIALCRRSVESALLVGEADGHLVGSVMVGQDGHRGWLYYVAVDPAVRGRGFGGALVRRAEAWLADRGVPKVHLMIRDDNASVRAFYRKLGYSDSQIAVMQRWLDEDAAALAAAGPAPRRRAD